MFIHVLEPFTEEPLTNSWVITIATKEPIIWTISQVSSCLLISISNDGLEGKQSFVMMSSGSHHLFTHATPSPETAWHDSSFSLGYNCSETVNWQGHWSPLTEQRCVCPKVASSRAWSPSASLANVRHVGWPPKGTAVGWFYPSPSPHQAQDPWVRQQLWEGKKNIFRIILEKGDMSEPLLEPRYQSMREEEWEREYEFFHLPFCETICNSLLIISLEESSGDGPLVAMAIILLCAAT